MNSVDIFNSVQFDLEFGFKSELMWIKSYVSMYIYIYAFPAVPLVSLHHLEIKRIRMGLLQFSYTAGAQGLMADGGSWAKFHPSPMITF